MGGGGRWDGDLRKRKRAGEREAEAGWRIREGLPLPTPHPSANKAEAPCLHASFRTGFLVPLMWLTSPDRQQVRVSLVTSSVVASRGL